MLTRFEKIETNYKDFHELFSLHPDDEYYIELPDGDLTKINATIEKSVDEMYKIEFDNGYKIECADTHAFMDVNGEPIFTKDLHINKKILTKNGKFSVKSKRKSENKVAYDINIDYPHWYVNDENGIIHHNTLLGLYCLKAYFNKYPDAICLFYDSEYGTTPDYLKSNGIDTSRVIHIPIEHIEQLKFDLVKRLKEIERGDRVFIFIDSVGNLASVKEVSDAEEEKTVADMSRAKALKSLFRIITPTLTTKDIPCVAINHVYSEIGLYPKTIMSGGTGAMYSANQVFIITKSQEKDGTDIIGYNFTINIEKSRYVREKAKFPFTVTYEKGIHRYSGLLEIGLESGLIIKPSNGWYQRVDPETGEILEGKYRQKETATLDFWKMYLESDKFNQWIEKRYKLGAFEDQESEASKKDDSQITD